MQVLKEIKIGRLVLAFVVTLLIADSVPHPSLSSGLIESSWTYLSQNLSDGEQVETAIAESRR